MNIISAFPGTGKTHFFNAMRDRVSIADSDSSQFDKAQFPENYIQHIKGLVAKDFTVLCSSHLNVRAALVRNNMPFILVYPHVGLRDEYLERYVQRNSPPEFVEMMRTNWHAFVDSCAAQPRCHKIVLNSGQYLSDMIMMEQ